MYGNIQSLVFSYFLSRRHVDSDIEIVIYLFDLQLFLLDT